MEEYMEALTNKIDLLQKSDSPLAKTRVLVLLRLLGELQKEEEE